MKRIIILLMLLVPVILFSQVKYYFSFITGNDNNTAVQAQNPATPWKTINKLNAFFTSLNPGDSVLFHRGEEWDSASIIAAKNGTSAASINFGAYGTGANPIISALIPIGGFTNISGSIWESAAINAAPNKVNIVTFNGVSLPMGKWPNGYGTNTAGWRHYTNGGANNLVTDAAGLAGAVTTVGATIVIRKNNFVIQKGRITGSGGSNINYTAYANQTVNCTANYGYFVQDALATLDLQNEWFWNRTTKKLDIFSSTAPTNIKIAYLQNVVSLSNRSFISFTNLNFVGSDSDAVNCTASTNIKFTGCNIDAAGQSGVWANLATNFTFQNGSITNSNDFGIYIASGTGNSYTGNTISNTGLNAGMTNQEGSVTNVESCNGIYSISSATNINNNNIYNSGYAAIQFNGSNVTIRNNFIDTTDITKDEGAAIYTFTGAGNTSGTNRVIDANIILYAVGAQAGKFGINPNAQLIYGDINSAHLTITNNGVAHASTAGIFLQDNQNDTVRGNIVYDAQRASLDMFTDGGANELLSRNIRIASNQFVMLLTTTTLGNCSYQTSEASFTAFGSSDSNVISFPTIAPVSDNNVWFTGINNGGTFTHRSLPTWQTASGFDLHSSQSPKTISDTTTNSIRFIYNNQTTQQTFSIPGTWVNMKNLSFTNTITLQPFTSTILLFMSNSNPPLTVSASASSISCFGGTATVTAIASGGSGSGYQYKLGSGSFQSSGAFTGVAAGTYTVTVQDGVGATASTNVTVVQPAQITIVEANTAILVNGGSSTVTISAGGGTGTLTYSMDGGSFQASNTFTLLAGNHTVTVKDANGCTNSLTFTITQPSVLTVSASPKTVPIKCFGGIDTIVVTASGATPPYQYSDDGGTTFQSSNQFNGVVAGTYTIVAKDNAGATATTSVTVSQNPQITITESNTVISVNGGSCTVTITASGGTGSLTYSLDNGTFQSSNVFSGVLAGPHSVVVKDGNACTNSLSFTITQPSVLVVSAAGTVNPLLCFGNTTTITVTASGGTTPYSYQINGGTPQSSNLFTSRGAGTYTLTVTDNSGVIQSVSLTITQPTQITISESHTVISVNGGTSTVTITASGGTSTLTYSLDGGAFQGSNVFNGVLAGSHTITVKDVNSCTNSLVFPITQPSALVVSAAVTTAIPCNNGTGTVTVTASGGTTPYQYKVGSGSLQSSNLFSGLVAGTYTFTVQDAGGSIASTTITVTQPAQIMVGTTVSGAAPATVTVTASGGVSPFTYKLDAGSFQSSNVFSGVAAGNHTVTVKDNNGCLQSTSFTVGSQLGITAVVGSILCNAGSTTVQINATGGIPPYTGTGTFIRTAGTYTFTVQDVSGATHDTTLTITQPALISVSESNTTISVNGGTCTVTITASGGVGTLQYSLDGGAYQVSNQFLAVFAGNHTVTVKDANNCTQSIAFAITQPGALGIGIARGAAIACFGGSQTITVSGSGGTTPYTFTVDNGTFTGTTVYSSLAGTHTYSVKDAFGTRKDTIITITQPTQITISVAYPPIAVNGGTTTVTVTASGGTSTLTYSLDGAAYQGSNVFAGVAAGPHTMAVKDANGCINTFPFSITQPTPLVVGISHGSISCYNGTISVTVSGTGGTTPYKYGENGIFQISNTFSGIGAGTYTFSVKDTFGARADTIITITQPTQIVINVTTGTIGTNGGNTTVTASAIGGTGGLQYSLDGGAYQGSGSFSGVLAGVHTVTVKDGNNCTNTNTFSISQPGALVIGISVATNPLLCYGDATNVTVTASGGTVPYTGTGTFSKTAGTYTFIVTDQFGAQADSIVTITQATQITVTQVVYGTITVVGGTAAVTITVAGGTPTPSTSLYNFQIDGGGYVLGGTANTFTFNTVTAGNHTINVKDNSGCIITYQINMPGPPKKGRKPINHIYING